MKQSHLIAANTFFIWGATVLQILPQLILVPFLITNIGDTGYGEYVLVWSLLLAIEQLELSLQSGATKYSAAYLAENRISDVNKVLSSTFLFSVFLGILSFILVVSIAATQYDFPEDMFVSLFVVGFMMLFLVPTTPFQGIILAKQRHYIKYLADILSSYIGFLIIVLWFHFLQPSIIALVIISVGTFLLSRLFQLPFAYFLVPGLRNSVSSFSWTTFRSIVAFGLMIVLSSLCIVVNTTAIRWISGILVSSSFVAHLAIFLMPGVLMARIVQAMTITVMPAASAFQATHNLGMLRQLFLRSTRYIVLVVIAVLLIAILLLREVLALWVGTKYEFLYSYAILNLIGVSILLSASCAHNMLKGFGELRKILLSLFVGFVLIPITFFVLIYSIWKTPYLAISLGLMLGNVVAGVLQTLFCFRIVKIDFKIFIFKAYLQPVSAALLSAIFAFGTIFLVGFDSLAFLILLSSVTILFLFSIFYFFIADQNERDQFKCLIQSFWIRFLGFFRKALHSL